MGRECNVLDEMRKIFEMWRTKSVAYAQTKMSWYQRLFWAIAYAGSWFGVIFVALGYIAPGKWMGTIWGQVILMIIFILIVKICYQVIVQRERAGKW